MPIRSCASVVLAFLCGVLSLPACAQDTTPGGAGVLRLPGAQQHCFKSNNPQVTEACGSFQVKWKLWSLMGEPVGNYVLLWHLDKLRIRDARDGRNTAFYAPESLPPPLSRAAQDIELYVDGVAFLTLPPSIGVGNAALPFNTGLGVRADGTESTNVPSGYNWNKFLLASRMFGKSWCAPDGRTYVEETAAKKIMKAGVKISYFELCPGSSADVSSLVNAMDRFCQDGKAANNYRFCARPQTPPDTPASNDVSDVLDRQADKPAVANKLKGLRDEFRRNATEACKASFAPVERCQARAACDKPAGPSDEECRQIPTRPPNEMVDDCGSSSRSSNSGSSSSSRRELTICLPTFRDRGGKDWDAKWGKLAASCKSRDAEQQRRAEQCQAASAAQCNPRGLSVEKCVAEKMANAPTEAQARKAFEAKGARPPAAQEKRSSPFLD